MLRLMTVFLSCTIALKDTTHTAATLWSAPLGSLAQASSILDGVKVMKHTTAGPHNDAKPAQRQCESVGGQTSSRLQRADLLYHNAMAS